MELKEQTFKSKKNGKEYVGYYVAIGKYRTPLFFPSEIERDYIADYLGAK